MNLHFQRISSPYLSYSFYFLFFLCFANYGTFAQGSFCDGSDANAGNIKLDGPFGNPTILNPNAISGSSTNIFQTESYIPGTPEIDQFKDLISDGPSNNGFALDGITPCSQTNLDWNSIDGVVNGNEPSGDLSGGSACGATDIIHDGTGSNFAYYTVVDQDCDATTVADAYLVFRIRLAKESPGAFGFSILLDTDNNCDTWSLDPSGNCSPHCFEREIWLGTGGGTEGLHIKDISGGVSPGTETAVIPISESQVACTSQAPTSCTGGNQKTIFYTFAVPLADLGMTSGNLDIGIVPATSNNPDDVVDGNYAFSDVGGINGNTAASANCPDCAALSGACLRQCLLTCATVGNDVSFPVEYLSFEGGLNNGSVVLNWATGMELNNQAFDIQRLSVSQEFESIGILAGNGSTDQTHYYSFSDDTPNMGTNYYRLKQIDFDGQYNYSSVLSVQLNPGTSSFNLHHTGTDEQLEVNLYSLSKQDLTFEILTITGQVIDRTHISAKRGNQVFNLNKPEMGSGVYLLRMLNRHGESLQFEKFLNL